MTISHLHSLCGSLISHSAKHKLCRWASASAQLNAIQNHTTSEPCNDFCSIIIQQPQERRHQNDPLPSASKRPCGILSLCFQELDNCIETVKCISLLLLLLSGAFVFSGKRRHFHLTLHESIVPKGLAFTYSGNIHKGPTCARHVCGSCVEERHLNAQRIKRFLLLQ